MLEVRSRDVPFLLEDGQPVGRLVYEKLAGAADELYGAARLELSGPGAEAVEALPAITVPLEITAKQLATGTATPLAAVAAMTKGLTTDTDIVVANRYRN